MYRIRFESLLLNCASGGLDIAQMTNAQPEEPAAGRPWKTNLGELCRLQFYKQSLPEPRSPPSLQVKDGEYCTHYLIALMSRFLVYYRR